MMEDRSIVLSGFEVVWKKGAEAHDKTTVEEEGQEGADGGAAGGSGGRFGEGVVVMFEDKNKLTDYLQRVRGIVNQMCIM